MSQHPAVEGQPVYLHEKQIADKNVVIHPEDDDLFVLTGRQAIQSCRLGSSVDLWLKELHSAQTRIGEWCEKRSDIVAGAWIAPKSSQLAVFILTDAETFDFELADQITELNSELISSFALGMIEILQIPASELDRFVNTTTARAVYGKSAAPSPAVDA